MPTKNPAAVKESKRAFWDDRAKLGELAGSNDFVLADMEHEVIRKLVKKGKKVLEVGAGSGHLLIELAEKNGSTGIGIDFAPKMVETASANAKAAKLDKKISFIQGDLLNLPEDIGQFDYVITKRSLCNLANGKEHRKAFENIMKRVKPKGFYLMIEDSEEALARVNAVRKSLGLYTIDMPWHNVFLKEKEIALWKTRNYKLEEIPFSSTYYFLSRVVYAALAKQKNEELKYDSDINMLSTKLPVLGDFGPTRLWLWQKIK